MPITNKFEKVLTLDQTIDDSISFTRGFMPRVTDQRVSVKIFFQDEMPRFQQLKAHLNLIYASDSPLAPQDQLKGEILSECQTIDELTLVSLIKLLKTVNFIKGMEK